jgi:predicted nucleotidyltransferase
MRVGLLLRRKRSKILEIARKYGATSICVFGSVARNEDDEKSDVDLIMVRGLKDRMRERVLKEAVLI